MKVQDLEKQERDSGSERRSEDHVGRSEGKREDGKLIAVEMHSRRPRYVRKGEWRHDPGATVAQYST